MVTWLFPCFSPFIPTSDSLDIRLMGGIQSAWFYSGRVEVSQINGTWGTVCNDRFDDREALVICKMIGYQYGKAKSIANFGRGTGRILMDEVNCNGNETSILDCPYNGWGRHNCGHYQDAGVECSSDEDKGKRPQDSQHFCYFQWKFWSHLIPQSQGRNEAITHSTARIHL